MKNILRYKYFFLILIVSITFNTYFFININMLLNKFGNIIDFKHLTASETLFIKEYYVNEKNNYLVRRGNEVADKWIKSNAIISGLLKNHNSLFLVFFPENFTIKDTTLYFIQQLPCNSIVITSTPNKIQNSIINSKITFIQESNFTEKLGYQKPISFFIDKNYCKTLIFTTFNCQNNFFINYFNYVLDSRKHDEFMFE